MGVHPHLVIVGTLAHDVRSKYRPETVASLATAEGPLSNGHANLLIGGPVCCTYGHVKSPRPPNPTCCEGHDGRNEIEGASDADGTTHIGKAGAHRSRLGHRPHWLLLDESRGATTDVRIASGHRGDERTGRGP